VHLSRWVPVKAGLAALVIGVLVVRPDDIGEWIGAYFIGVAVVVGAGLLTWCIFGFPTFTDESDIHAPTPRAPDPGLRAPEATRALTTAYTAPAAQVIADQRRMDAAQALTTAYSKVLQTPRDHFWPLSRLPAGDKEAMKTALKLDAAYQASQGTLDKPTPGGKTMILRDTYIMTYAMLANFVADDLADRVNPYWRLMKTSAQRMKAGEQVDWLAEVTKLAPSEEDAEATARAHEEMQTLADEMTAFLDRIAPRKEP
jgi:hypothetical protein